MPFSFFYEWTVFFSMGSCRTCFILFLFFSVKASPIINEVLTRVKKGVEFPIKQRNLHPNRKKRTRRIKKNRSETLSNNKQNKCVCFFSFFQCHSSIHIHNSKQHLNQPLKIQFLFLCIECLLPKVKFNNNRQKKINETKSDIIIAPKPKTFNNINRPLF